VSGKQYRADQIARSDLSGKTGHPSEFIACHETRHIISRAESEVCQISGHYVRPGVLVTCAVTGAKVLPSLTATCDASGVRVLRDRLVSSSISASHMLREKAVQSQSGKFCLPTEAHTCVWSGRKSHPDDIRACSLTGLPIHFEFVTAQSPPRLRPLVEMLDGMRRGNDQEEVWDRLQQHLSSALKSGTCRVEAAVLSPSRQYLAACAENKKMLGFKVQQVGAIYDLVDDAVVGRLAAGKRNGNGWVAQ